MIRDLFVLLTYTHVWIMIFIAITVIAMVYFYFNRPKEDSDNTVVTSKVLQKKVNNERQRRGLYNVPEINNAAGANTGNLARKDKSFSSVFDFFIQLFSRKK